MKVVKVYGALRELLGKTRFEFVADTPAQAMRALLVNFPELQQWLLDSEKNGVAYRVTVGRQKIHNLARFQGTLISVGKASDTYYIVVYHIAL